MELYLAVMGLQQLLIALLQTKVGCTDWLAPFGREGRSRQRSLLGKLRVGPGLGSVRSMLLSWLAARGCSAWLRHLSGLDHTSWILVR